MSESTLVQVSEPGLPPVPARIRADFPLLSRDIDGHRLVYLDSAATSLTPLPVVEEISRFYTEVAANIHRGKHVLSEQASDDFENVRMKVAQYTGFRGNEVVFTSNTTASMNLVASGLPLDPDDLVLVPADGHHSAILPWRDRARVAWLPTDGHGVVDLDRYAELLSERPAVVVLSHCSNVSGAYAPVETMSQMAKEAGAVTVLDAAQSIGHRRPKHKTIDFLAFSAHKMLGPTGLGVLCGRYDQLARLTPPALGGGVVDWVDEQRHELRKLPHRFEAGTPHIAGVYGLGAAIDYLYRLGLDTVAEHDRALGRALVEQASTRPYARILGPTEGDRGAILSLAIDGLHSMKPVAQILSDSYGIMCRSGHMCAQPFVDRFTDDEILRASGYIYNDLDDVHAFFTALDEIVGALGARS